MAELMHWVGMAWRLLLAGFVALLPGMTVWFLVVGMAATVRRLGRSARRGGLTARMPADQVP